MSRRTLEARSKDSNKALPKLINRIQPLQHQDPFPYGWRYVMETLPNGKLTYYEIPLTATDLLDPQLGDQVVQHSTHQRSNNELFDMLDNHYEDIPTIAVFNDLKMKWGIAGLKEPAPDIAVVPNIKNKELGRSSFDVVTEGTRPCLVVEMMSDGYPGDDVEKVKIYEQAGVEEYIIINPHSNSPKPYYEMWGYRRNSVGKYQPIEPDTQGRIFSQTTQLWFSIEDFGQRLGVKDALTGKWLLTAKEEKSARIKAEAKVLEETKARLAETQARIDAEVKMLEAEKRTQWLEQRLRELEAKK